MAEALDRGMPTTLAAQAVYGTGAAPPEAGSKDPVTGHIWDGQRWQVAQPGQQPQRRLVSIELTISVELEPDEVWPDGEPEGWTAEHVLAEMQKLSTTRLIDDWDLDTFGSHVEVQALGKTARGELR
jgi:hypothetical protein